MSIDIVYEANEIASFYSLWITLSNCSKDKSNEVLTGFENPEIKKLTDTQLDWKALNSNEGEWQKLKKITTHIAEGKINNIEELINAMPINSCSKGENPAETLKNKIKFKQNLRLAYQAFDQFYNQEQTQKEITKCIEAYKKQNLPHNETMQKIDYCFSDEHDRQKTLKCYITPLPDQVAISGHADDMCVFCNLSLKRKNNEQYVGDSLLLERRCGTPLHEATHFIFNNSALYQELFNYPKGKKANFINTMTTYFSNNPQEKPNPKMSAKGAVTLATHEAFASYINASIYEKQHDSLPPTLYSGFKAADKLAKSIYPIMKDYVENHKKFDDDFFDRILNNSKEFSQSNTMSSPAKTRS